MQRNSSKVAIVGAVFVVIAGLTIAIRGDEALRQRTGFPQDWSHSHLIFSNPGSFAQAVRNGSVAHWYKIMNEPRYQIQQLRRNAAALQPNAVALKSTPPKPAPLKSSHVAKDWNFSLQTNATDSGVPWARYPAKYSFSETGANCSSDFVVFGLYVPGSSTQANLVGVNNVYVGASEGGGCGSITGNGGSGTYPTPQVKWAFNVSTEPVMSSVVLSLDGTKVAYVVTSPPVLQVLTLPSGQTGTVTSPTSPSTTCNGTAPSLCTVSLSSSTGDSNSYPYVDYATDTGYVGADGGWLYKITNFFSKNGTAPAIASGWPKSAGTAQLSSPVYDGATGTVFVGSFDGNLYAFNAATGSQITGSPLDLAAAGVNSSDGLYYDPPIVDSTNHVLYASYGDNLAGTAAELAQVVYYDHTAGKVEFVSGSAGTPGSTSTAVAGTNKAAFSNTSPDIYATFSGAFNINYFTNFPSGSSFLYACGAYSTSNVGVTLQQFSFNGSGQLQGSPTVVDTISTTLTVSFPPQLCSPPTEFYNTNGTPVDYLFLSVPYLASQNFRSYTIPTGGGTTNSMTPSATTVMSGGTSGMIVDGDDPTTNASSLYFTDLSSGATACTISSGSPGNVASPANNRIGTLSTAICAYKLTQSGLE